MEVQYSYSTKLSCNTGKNRFALTINKVTMDCINSGYTNACCITRVFFIAYFDLFNKLNLLFT